MRGFVVASVTCLQLAMVPPPPAAGQALEPRLPAWAVPPATQSTATRTPWHTRLFSGLGGAALGAGVGFFASQVFRGDWDEAPGRREVDRPAWAAVGGSIGLAVGISFPLGGRGAPPAATRGVRGGRYALTADEFRANGYHHALEAVRALRPEWLNARGIHIIGESADETITVYLDDVRMGGIESLRQLHVQMIRAMHLLDAGAATARWGAGHSHGVILVINDDGGDRRNLSPLR